MPKDAAGGSVKTRWSPEPITVRVPDAVRMTGLSRSRVYLLMSSGEIETVKVGRNTLILVESLKAFIQRQR